MALWRSAVCSIYLLWEPFKVSTARCKCIPLTKTLSFNSHRQPKLSVIPELLLDPDHVHLDLLFVISFWNYTDGLRDLMATDFSFAEIPEFYAVPFLHTFDFSIYFTWLLHIYNSFSQPQTGLICQLPFYNLSQQCQSALSCLCRNWAISSNLSIFFFKIFPVCIIFLPEFLEWFQQGPLQNFIHVSL